MTVRIVSEGDADRSAIFVDGHLLDNVYRLDLTIEAGDVARATVHMHQAKADVELPTDRVTFTERLLTSGPAPIYDRLSAEWRTQRWLTAVDAGRCPLCETGASHVASRCPNDPAKQASQCPTP